MSLNREFESTGNWLFKHRSFLPLFIIPFLFYLLLGSISGDLEYILLYSGLIISFIGEGIRIFTVAYTPPGTSGRNTKQQLANTLNTTGIYSLLRHPLYLGNFLMYQVCYSTLYQYSKKMPVVPAVVLLYQQLVCAAGRTVPPALVPGQYSLSAG